LPRRELALALGVLAAACSVPSSETHAALERKALLWGGEQQLLASDSAELDQFGYSVALNAERAVVGAYGDDSFRGAAYVFVWENGAWTEEQKLVASDGVSGDNFGWAVALSGDRVLVGAYGADGYRGAAYVFARSGGAWMEDQKLLAGDSAENDQLGYSVGIDGGRALVGAYGHDVGRGAAYVFSMASGSWDRGRKLLASDGLADDDFGYAVAIVGERALVGAPGDDHYRGAAYVFESDGSAWSEAQKLLAESGVESEQFGNAVALAAERAVVGAYWSADFRGAAHVFARVGGSWEAEQRLVASDGDVGHRFGNSVSLDGGRALIAASRYDSGLGAAYVFAKRDAGWSEEQKLLASDGDTGDLFAWSVAMAGERAVVGANYADQLRGKAYAFELGAEPDRPGPGDAPEPKPESELCSSGNECVSGHCEDGLCCDRSCSASERCRAELKVSGEDGVCGPSTEAVLGAACKFDVQCSSGRCADGRCSDRTSAEVPPPAQAPANASGCGYSGANTAGNYQLVACVCAASLLRWRFRPGRRAGRRRLRGSAASQSCR
jgi:hypothetical protein